MKMRFIILFVLFFIVLFIVGKIPVKRAISVEKDDEEKENTFICEYIEITGPDWEAYNLKTKEYEFVFFEGNTPNKKLNKNTFFHFSHNKFLVKGEIIGKKIISESGDITAYYYKENESIEEIAKKYQESYEIFDIIKVSEWDIVSPIDRGESLRIFAPKEYLNIYDFIF